MATAPATSRAQHSRVLLPIVLGLVLAPLVVTIVAVAGTHWYPASDRAIEVLRIADVGGRHTPLTGAYSRWGWDHPGPLLFWLLAPFRWVAGDQGILVGVACINAAAVAGAVLVARRRGGTSLMLIVAAAVLLLVRAGGPSLLVDPWNPWVAVLPFLTYVLLAWAVAERDYAMLPFAVVAGSFVVQAHAGYLPLVATVAVVAAALAFLRGRGETDPGSELLRWAALAGACALAAWLAPLVQQLTGNPGNLGELLAWSRDPGEPAVGLAYGFGMMGRELPFTWLHGDDAHPYLGVVLPAWTVPALVLVAVTLAAGAVAWRRGAPQATRLALLATSLVAVGIVAGARIVGVLAPYIVRWWWVAGALLWCALVWSLFRLWGRPVTPVVQYAACAALACLSLVVIADATSARVPVTDMSETVGALAPPVAGRLSRSDRYLVDWIGTRDFGGTGVGLYYELRERGYDVGVVPEFGDAFGSWRTVDPDAVEAVVMVVPGEQFDGFVAATPAAEHVATHETERDGRYSAFIVPR
jgi:hypothetical protein